MVDRFFFGALPYLALLLFAVGALYRAFTGFKGAFRGKPDMTVRGDMQWTTRSTGFFGRASVGPAVLCLHWGLILLLVGHTVGFLGGWASRTGWVDFFRWTGMAAGILVLYGACWALARRYTIPQVRAMSRVEDFVLLAFLALIAGLGLYHSALRMAWGVSYSVGPWAESLFALRPDAALMSSAPFSVKLHMIAAMLFFCYFPFTKLVHAWSFPFGYASRPYISMRSYAGVKK